MVLAGLSTALYVGWVSGVLPLKTPTGPPTISPTKSFRSLLTSVTYALMTLLWVDFHIRHLKVLEGESSTSVDKFLSLSLFIGASLFDLYFRLCFHLRGKIVARFLKSLEADLNKMPITRMGPGDRKTWTNYKHLIFFVHVYHCSGAVLTSLWVAAVIPEDTRLLGFISSSVYPVIFLLFGAIPLVSSFFVSFAFVISTTLHIQWIFDDFAAVFQEQIEAQEQLVLNPMKRDLGEIYTISSSSKKGSAGGSSNDQILGKFEHLKQLCSQYDKICGPLLLGLLVRAVFILISTANTMMLYDGGGSGGQKGDKKLKLFLNVFHFMTELSQLVLLQLGHMMISRISEKKEDLHRKVILMTNLTSRDQFKEAVAVISEWDWIVSGGPGFFEVDRPLLSGVVSSLMTYVTILFQLNVGNDEVGIVGPLLSEVPTSTTTSSFIE